MDTSVSSSPKKTGDGQRWFKAVLAIDPRSLATCRIALGLLLLLDLALRVPDLEAMNTDAGIMPIESIRNIFEGTWRWSLHWLDGSYGFQVALFVLASLFAVALLVGWQTRVATIGCWILWASLHTRGPLIINAGDTLMRVLLFWAMFVPWGRIWSVDAWRAAGGGSNRFKPVVSAGTAALLVQVCIIYWFTAIYKLLNENWQAGEGLHNALAWGGYNKPLGIFLLERPEWMSALSYATIWLELIGPILVLLPWGRRYLRPAVIAAFFSFHIGIELCMYVGLFSYVSMAAWTLFLPSEFWNSAIWQRLGFGGSRRADSTLR